MIKIKPVERHQSRDREKMCPHACATCRDRCHQYGRYLPTGHGEESVAKGPSRPDLE